MNQLRYQLGTNQRTPHSQMHEGTRPYKLYAHVLLSNQSTSRFAHLIQHILQNIF